jgi:hypothetical protein
MVAMQFLKKLNMVNYICMYDVYKLSYKKHFQLTCNYNTINWFFDMTIYLLIPRFFKGVIVQQL